MELSSVDTLRSLPDDALVALLKEQPEAFSVLLERCRTMIVRTAERYAAGQADAEDYAQEGLLGLLSAADSYQPGRADGAAFRTYAYQCIRNSILNAYRKDHTKLQASVSSLEDSEAVWIMPDHADTPEQAFLQKERISELYLKLRDVLSRQELEVLSDTAGGFTYHEIARRMQISEKSVSNALQRARRKLRAAKSRAEL